jgi:hypothetical protein
MKGATLISAIAFIAITVSAMALILNSGLPIIQRMQSSASLDRMTSTFTELDRTIVSVASEGNGSRRVFDMDTGQGRLALDTDSDSIYWQLDSENSVLRPRTARFIGNVASGSNIEASLYEGSHEGFPAFVLENSHLKAFIRKVQPAQSYSTDSLLLGVYQKDLGEWLALDYLGISVDSDPSSESGTGWTEADMLGPSLPRATVIAYISSDYANYSVSFTLESGADFLIVQGSLA